MKYRLCRFLAIILVVAFLTGCMGPPPIATPNPDFLLGANTPAPEEEEPPPAPPAAPVAGGHLRIAMPMPSTLNPLLNADAGVDAVLRLIFEPLVIFDNEARPMPNPAITQSVVFSADGGSLAISLRDGIFWEDGSAITAADIAFSIDVLRFSAPAGAIYRENVTNIASHSVLDARTLQVNLAQPSWAMKYNLNFPIIPAAYYQPVSMTNLTAARNMHPLGNGPFRFFSYEAAGQLELIANDNAPGGAPYISRVTAVILRDGGGMRYAFEQNLTDILVGSAALWGRYSALGKNRAAQILSNEFDFIGFNTARALFADPAARAAAAHSFDLDAIIQRYYSHEDAAAAPVNPESWLAAEELVRHDFDINRAAAYFAQLYEIPTVSIIVNEANAEGMSTAAVLADGLHAARADVLLEPLAFSDFMQRIESADFDIMVGGILSGPLPNFDFLHTALGYNSDELDLNISLMRHAISETALGQAAAAMQHYIAQHLPILGLGFRRQALYTVGHVHGDIRISANDVFANINRWFIYEQ